MIEESIEVRLNKHLSEKEISTLENIVNKNILESQKNIHNAQEELDRINQVSGKDEVDFASDSMLRQNQTRFLTRESFYLKKLLNAKKLIKSGEYGICKECGVDITYQRLLARPTSDMCINCKEEAEKEEKQSVHGRTSKSLGKELNNIYEGLRA